MNLASNAYKCNPFGLGDLQLSDLKLTAACLPTRFTWAIICPKPFKKVKLICESHYLLSFVVLP
ncbi:hypothetical protein C5167_002916 [Papaver somniferum]|uniref:Uncharacterized protein n=1 Tax=Papaver somniferum TaxID=3469 RepID=A0A4Y7L0H7_PAPSO|nr:hypothetical protein C5167_002916 [Papaver somniferum]